MVHNSGIRKTNARRNAVASPGEGAPLRNPKIQPIAQPDIESDDELSSTRIDRTPSRSNGKSPGLIVVIERVVVERMNHAATYLEVGP